MISSLCRCSIKDQATMYCTYNPLLKELSYLSFLSLLKTSSSNPRNAYILDRPKPIKYAT